MSGNRGGPTFSPLREGEKAVHVNRMVISAALTAAMVSAGGVAAAGPRPVKAAKVTRDFNGDGYQDLAVGAPNGKVGDKIGAGYVAVVYGSRSGLDLSTKKIISQDSSGVPGPAAENAGFGTSIASGDLNGDGYADLAIGSPDYGPYENGFTFHGAVTVLFGGADGLGHATSVSGTYSLGNAVGMGDVNGDGRAELLATETPSNFGALYLFDVAQGAYTLNPLPHADWSGLTAITTGDVNGDGYADVLTSYPAVGGTPWTSLYLGSASGLRADGVLIEPADTAAFGDIDHDGRADLVTGYFSQSYVPGQVSVRYGTRQGLHEEPDLTIDQDTRGVPGTNGEYDQFGSSVAVGDATGDGYADVAVGVQGKPAGEATRAGTVVLLKGGPRGLTTTGARSYSQDTPGVPDAAEQDDLFGWGVSLIDFNRDGRADLVSAAVGENKRNPNTLYRGDGAVSVLPGTRTGATGTGSTTFGPADLGADPADAGLGWSLIP
jgi:hypothetical protein